MMHNVENTDTEIIKKNYRNLSDTEKTNPNCVLITTGSFNPIHRSHIKNLQIVKNYLKKHGSRPMNVLAAYISPTHDSYVRNKLGSADWISQEERCRLCEEVIKSEQLGDWIAVSKGEVEYTGFVDFDEVSENLVEFLNSSECDVYQSLGKPLTVVYVCGLDHFNKCPYVARLAKRRNMACAVIYRLGASDDHIKVSEKNSPSNIYYITLEDERETLIDISSTAIRRQYQTLTDIDSDKSTYPCVIEYYKKKFSNSNQ